MPIHNQYLYGSTLAPEGLRVFGVPGASLNSSGFDVKSVSAGLAGEVAVAKVLDEIANSTQGFYVFHSVKLPGHYGDIDHLVLYGDHLIIVDAKNWAGNHAYHVKRNASKVTRDTKTFQGGEVHLVNYVTDVKEKFRKQKVKGVLCVAKDNVELTSDTKQFDFVDLKALDEGLRTFIQKKGIQPDVPPAKLAKFTALVMNPKAEKWVQEGDRQELDLIRDGNGVPKVSMEYPKRKIFFPLLGLTTLFVSAFLILDVIF